VLISSAGTITGNLKNAGQITLSPGFGPLEVRGTFEQTASGLLNVELAGPAVTQSGTLLITGPSVTLDGTLNVSLLGGFVPAVNSQFIVLRHFPGGGTIPDLPHGDFATFSGLTLPGGHTLSYFLEQRPIEQVVVAGLVTV